NLERFSLGGRADLRQVSYGSHAADSLGLVVDVPNPRLLDTMVVRAAAADLEAFGRRLDSAFVRWERRDAVESYVTFRARRDTSVSIDAGADVAWSDEARRVR